jgi:hypothetical protein
MQCGAAPASWISAEIVPGPADVGEPTVGEFVAPPLSERCGPDPVALFPTAAPGTSNVDVNPELRVRY